MYCVCQECFHLQEMDRELAPVRAQAAHVNFLQGNSAAAAASYSTLLLQNLQQDMALHAVCTNNSLCSQTNMDSVPKVCVSHIHTSYTRMLQLLHRSPL